MKDCKERTSYGTGLHGSRGVHCEVGEGRNFREGSVSPS